MPETAPIEKRSLLLEIENLTVEHRTPRGDTVLAPRNVSLWVNRGEILTLVGERGAGKSAITQAMAGIQFPGSKQTSGEIRFDGKDLSKLSVTQLRDFQRKNVAFLLRDPHSQLNPFITIREHLRETIELARQKSKFGNEADWAPIFYEVGIIEPEKILDHRPDDLSTELAMRIMLATALFTEAELLVCDQATAEIEPATALHIHELLRQLRSERNLAILMTTDNLFNIEKIADRVIILFEGGIVEIGSADRIIRQPKNDYTRALLDAIPRLGQKRARLGELGENEISEGRIAINKNSGI